MTLRYPWGETSLQIAGDGCEGPTRTARAIAYPGNNHGTPVIERPAFAVACYRGWRFVFPWRLNCLSFQVSLGSIAS
jgi:hypothetical protein